MEEVVAEPVILVNESVSEPTIALPAVAIQNIQDLKSLVVGEVEEISSITSRFDLDATHIQSSPYADPLNFLDLRELDWSVRLFALALTQWRNVRPDYATSLYLEIFNWDEVFESLRDMCAEVGIQWKRTEFYVVIFRSKLRDGADRGRLGELDQMSHQEACASGGLLHYWFGSPDAERKNLATCIWRNGEDAVAGGKGLWHRRARGAAREMYENISFERLTLVVEDGAHSWYTELSHE